MSIAVNQAVFLLLMSIIPALIVLVVCMLRVETIRGDAKAVSEKLSNMVDQYVRIVAQHHDITDRISTLSAGLHETGLRISNLDESITSTNNKLASRDRADRIAQSKRREEIEPAEIPGTKQTAIDFSKIPGAIPLQPVAQQPVKREREFGEYPEEWNL
jgi:septal ring factor EnvC (AmiA/AmiB activator)